MSELPVRQIVLFKHGVGFFQREGKAKSDEATLTFRHDEINDVLKSLVAVDQGDGQVLGIYYETPPDYEARMADSSIHLSEEASLCDLLRDLRGRSVELAFTEQTARGRLVGLDLPQGDDHLDSTLISVVDSEGEVRVFRLKTLHSVRLTDEQAAHDLSYFLDNSLKEDLRRAVTIRMSPGKHRLVVYYVAPSPTWRVSYRVVAESDDEGTAGTALLQGWGIFDNRLDEDLNDVSVTLVAGQPISFIYDLYSSRIPERPTVEDEARIAPGPVEFKGELKRARKEAPAGEAVQADRFFGGAPAPAPQLAAAPMSLAMDAAATAVSPAAEGRESGEFFQYVVSAPVTVKRGESALVPIISTEIVYSRELLYNGAKLPAHPVVALRFSNSTGLTLERGPVTIVEDGEYRGEAVIPFTRSDNEVYLAFAVELGVRVTERVTRRTEMAGLDIREGYLLINEYHVESTTYVVENTTDKSQVVTVEAPIRADYELFDTAPPDAQTAGARRWRVIVPPQDSVEFDRQERRLLLRHEQVRRLDYRQLQRFFEGKWLDQHTFERLNELLDSLAFIDEARAEQEAIKTERTDIYARQDQLRQNLNTLKPAGDEGMLRQRVLTQLASTETRLEEIDQRVADLETQIAEAEALIEQTLEELGRGEE